MCFAGTFMTACMSAGAVSRADHTSVFSHRGYTFVGALEEDVLRVKVPCCQTYVADDAFKALMVDAAELHYRGEVSDPEFTEGWVGLWQMVADLS
jgi:hypothetical protein